VQDLARILGVDPEALRGAQADEARAGRGAGRTTVLTRIAVWRGASGSRRTLLRLLLRTRPEPPRRAARSTPTTSQMGSARSTTKLLDAAWEDNIDLGNPSFQQRAEGAGAEGFAAEIAPYLFRGRPGRLVKDTLRRVKELRIVTSSDVLRERLGDLPEDSAEAVAFAEALRAA